MTSAKHEWGEERKHNTRISRSHEINRLGLCFFF